MSEISEAASQEHRAAEPATVRMANDIARQFAHLPPAEGAAAVRAHIVSFWDPRMRVRLAEEAARGPEELDPLVLAALSGQ